MAQSQPCDGEGFAIPAEPKGLYKFGGISFIASAGFFLAGDIFEFMAGSPPATGAEIVAWIASTKLSQALISETLFFAAMFLIPATIALYRSMGGTDDAKTAAGCGIIAVVISLLAVLLVVHGRLVYPVYGITANAPMAAELVIGIFYGGIHAVYELLAIATLLISLTMRQRVYGKKVAFLGMATSVFDIVAAYQYAIGPALTLLCKGFLAVWFFAVGLKLLRMGKGELAASAV